MLVSLPLNRVRQSILYADCPLQRLSAIVIKNIIFIIIIIIVIITISLMQVSPRCEKAHDFFGYSLENFISSIRKHA